MTDYDDWIGRTTEAEDELTGRRCAEFIATFEDLLFAVPRDDAPLGMHWCLSAAPVPVGGLGEDGLPAEDGFRPPIPLPTRMAAGSTLRIAGPLARTAAVRRLTSIAAIESKDGRSGPLVFLTLRHDYRADGRNVLTEDQTIVYRGPSPGHAPPPGSAPGKPDRASRGIVRERVVDNLAVRMFRYSAMTANAHRIHYDADYAREREGYPGLVVHGPLQATLLLNLAAICGGAAPRSFSYRAVSALIATAPFRIRASEAGDGALACWSEDADGRTCMEATARWT